MRQALESDIIKLSMDIRNGKPLAPFNGNDVKVIERKQLVTGMYEWADQIIVGKNATRRAINTQVRELYGRTSEPEAGDKIICLKNYWDVQNGYKDSLINGMIGTINTLHLGVDQGVLGRPMKIDFKPDFVENEEFGCMENLSIDYKLMKEGNPTFARDAKPIYKNGKRVPFPMEFDYGYAITCWKAQGSQFNKVLFFTERMGRMSDIDYAKYIYTGITRAVEKIVIVL